MQCCMANRGSGMVCAVLGERTSKSEAAKKEGSVYKKGGV